MKSSPKISIGLPVFNGERFIKETLDSLLKQTFKEFEIIISDNASSDNTEQICKKYELIDSRIKYLRCPENKGAIINFERVLMECSGHYFMWAASDDKYEDTHLENLLQAFESNISASLVMSNAKIIDEYGYILSQTHLPKFQKFDSPQKLTYALALGSKHHYFIYGLWVRTILLDLLPIPRCRFGDRIFILFASTRVKFILVEEATYYRRKHGQISSDRYRKTDVVLSKLYRSQLAAVKSVYHLQKKLANNLHMKKYKFHHSKILILYTYWVLFGVLYSMKIAQPIRFFSKLIGLRPKNFGFK